MIKSSVSFCLNKEGYVIFINEKIMKNNIWTFKGSCIVFNNSTSAMIFGNKFSNSEASEVRNF